jgi:hypothetical protein
MGPRASSNPRDNASRPEPGRVPEVMDPNGPIVPHGTTSEELRTKQTDLIRSYLTMLSDFNGRRRGVKDWDPMVYAGVVERIDYDFMWGDLHWRLDKVEHLRRTKVWNEGLKK